ncbi:MAG TPA: amidohydrolase [Candidatus Acidoferrales bacterium]|nr:amidohydrolase [Candidatus Acidoferrales bacterium]
MTAALAAGIVLGAVPAAGLSSRDKISAISEPTHAPADLVLTNGDVYTVDSAQPRAQAIAIRGEKIVAVGSSGEIHAWIGPHTRVVDLHGRFAMPGFNDAHVHLASGGMAKLTVNLEGTKSLAEFQQRIRDALENYKPGGWITGSGWDHTLWPGKRFPTRYDLDAVSKDHPMIFERVDGHVAVANSLALKIAGVTSHTQDTPGSHIVRDEKTGEPNGMLEEAGAMSLVYRHVPQPSHELRKRAIELALEDAVSHGVTSIQDYSTWSDFLVYRELKNEGKLPLRITEWLTFTEPLAKLEQERREGGTTDPWLRTGTLKAFMDGSLGSRTAAMLAPYSDDPSTSGIPRMEAEELNRMSIERDKAGFQLNFHAIGDRANRMALDAFAAVEAANGPRDRRDRVEHAQIVAPQDFERFAKLHVIASMQPSHLLDDQRWATARIGPERAKGAYAWNTMRKDGVRLAFGTDYPVEPIDPLRGIYECVTRELPEGGPAGGWQPQEKLPVDVCIYDYTAASAYAEFEEARKGQLRAGMFADIVVYLKDITRMPPAELLHTSTDMTITGGRVVYERH